MNHRHGDAEKGAACRKSGMDLAPGRCRMRHEGARAGVGRSGLAAGRDDGWHHVVP